MKVIGGPLDGVNYKATEYEYEPGFGVLVKLPNSITSVQDFFKVDKILEMMTESYVRYTVRCMTYNTNETKNKQVDTRKIWYLALPDWSDWEAIEFQMRK